MHGAGSLAFLLVLGSAWALQVAPVLTESLTQKNFDLDQFMGKWYEVAVVSTCPYYMQRKRGNPVIVALELKPVASEGSFTMTASIIRNGSCEDTATHYNSTHTPGRFFHHVSRFGADVDSFVVHTNYDEYAMMLLLSTEKPSGNKTTSVKLYSRTVDVGPAVLDRFKTLVKQHGMSDEAIILNQYKGECVPGEQLTEPTTQHRSKRNVAPPGFPAQEEYTDTILPG
ncbi:protein AMBP-like [Brachyistius frenatus]|uniref:protein AMBP-like n=1 Tax=Brachyistius frenatus TaxID=100188 RepID=UPI0037E79159